MSNDTGGAAYPVSWAANGAVNIKLGMTLLDHFAGQAMEGDWASQSEGTGEIVDDMPEDYWAERAKLYYRQAAAMLAEKRRRETT